MAMAPRLVTASIVLDEWEIAEEYAEWDTKLLALDHKMPNALNLQLRAEIAAEIGAADDARVLYASAITVLKQDERGSLILQIAELERQLGAPGVALSLIRQWIAMDQPVASWIAGWDQVLETLALLSMRSHPEFAMRCNKAMRELRKATSSYNYTYDHYIEYGLLRITLHAKRTPEEWQRLLELADLMEQNAKASGVRALGSWPVLRAEALNALGRSSEAEDLAWRSIRQLHKHSWRRLWFKIEIARAA